MNSQRVAVYQGALIVIVILSAVLLSGCGGDGGNGSYGGARGYVYQPTTGGPAIISALPTPPAGYTPVPAGTVVRIEGYPLIQTTTDANGFYYLPVIPVGLRNLVVEAPGGTITLSIPIIANRITEGGGHTEGGG